MTFPFQMAWTSAVFPRPVLTFRSIVAYRRGERVKTHTHVKPGRRRVGG